ncbi:acyltransferase [Hymenobacter sp. BT507]|uniref:Acyltransferase n=1 Tax=Hymenobacter citatus TaxID=2763506 RepID=A0ABR7MNL6_9BACT|nr:acyltransferase [Hymenobacter citatus]MBC6612671.1 acyltransferase [Hymenobacter citatus]
MASIYTSVTTPPKYYPALTGVRAVAALMVFLFHAAPVAPMDAQSHLFKWPIRFVQQGYIGVNIFFVLSGFLITTRYFDRFELTGLWFRHYLQSRFARIYPIYFLLTLFTFLVMIFHYTGSWYEWPQSFELHDKIITVFINITLTRAFFNDIVFVGVPTAWTLTVEETFYLFAPFLFLGLKQSIRWIYVYPLLLLLTGGLLVAFCSNFLPYYGLMKSMGMMLSDTFFGRCVEFIIGIGLALWMNRRPHAELYSTRKMATLVGGLGILACMILMTICERMSSPEDTVIDYGNHLLIYAILPVFIAVTFWGLIHERTKLQQLLQSKLFILLGKSSYVFYLIHVGVVDLIFSQFIAGHWMIRLLAYTLFSIALYKWVESPMQKLLRPTSLKSEYLMVS